MRHDERARQALYEPRQTPAETPPRGGGVARVVEPDPLLRLHAEQAASGLGFAVVNGPAAQVDVCFVGLDTLAGCSRCGPRQGFDSGDPGRPALFTGPAGPLVVGYVGGPPVLAAAHAAHTCTDVVARLQVSDGRAVFVYPIPRATPTNPVRGRTGEIPACLTAREADVLLLIFAGQTTKEIAARLCLSPATVRSHCRSLLLKANVANRRALRARCLGAARPDCPTGRDEACPAQRRAHGPR